MSRHWLIAVSGSAHLAIAVGLFVSGIWRLERLDADPVAITLRLPAPLPPAPSGGPVHADLPEINPKQPKSPPKGPVQPHPKPPEAPTPDTGGSQDPGPGKGSGDPTEIGTCTENCRVAETADPVCGDGSVDTSEQCDDSNTTSGDGCSSTCRLEPKPEPPRIAQVAPNVLQGLRISGETQIRPSTVTQSQLMREGRTSVHGVVKVCIATDGAVASATMKVSTKLPDYDATLLSAIQNWRYQPYRVNGAPVPACSLVSFIFTIR